MRALIAVLMVFPLVIGPAAAEGVDQTLDGPGADVRVYAMRAPGGPSTHTQAFAIVTSEDGRAVSVGASCTDYQSDADCDLSHAGAAVRLDGRTRVVALSSGHLWYCEDAPDACSMVL